MGRKSQKFYAVRIGRRPGVYETWAETEQQVKGFPRAAHKSFETRAEAELFVGVAASSSSGTTGTGRNASGQGPGLLMEDIVDSDFDVSEDSIKPAISPQATLSASRTQPSQPHSGRQRQHQLKPQLTPEQSQILDRILLGENLFYTGPAGTGKSVLLRAVIDAFEENERTQQPVGHKPGGEGPGGEEEYSGGSRRRRGWKLGITASTGMAAVNIGGCTLHSWAGIGLGKQPIDKLYEVVLRNNLTLKRWREVDALIIDEISMIPASLLDTLSALGSRLRKNPLPFGGIQIIASGDFYQLPPVPDRPLPDPSNPSSTPQVIPPKFAFEADCWSSLFPPSQIISLTRIFRQSESTFISLLGRLRRGTISPIDIALLKGCERKKVYTDGIEPVSLLASKKEVALINERRLQMLQGSVQGFVSWDEAGVNSRGFKLSQEQAVDVLDRNTRWEKEVGLKVGALVMLLVNMQDGHLVNGSTGIITSFLTLAEALQQGIYVPDRALFGNPSPTVSWPVIDFVPPQPTSSRKAKARPAMIPQMSVTVYNAQGEAEAVRHQVPLMLAWGMTVHKSQGQSIERLRVDLSRIFEHGQTYVALSRATNLETLEVKGFTPDKVMAHPKVIEWSKPFEEKQAMEMEWEAMLADDVEVPM